MYILDPLEPVRSSKVYGSVTFCGAYVRSTRKIQWILKLYYWIVLHNVGMSEKRGHFFSKYADHVSAKYQAKICGNRPRLHIRVNLACIHFWGDGIAQSLFSKFTAYQSLESTCIGLIGRKLYCFSEIAYLFNLQQQIVCIIASSAMFT